MHALLTKLLNKRGIKAQELEPEEKATFETWKGILSKEELTLPDLKDFCKTQIDVIEGKWNDFSFQHKADLIPYYTTYKNILLAIDAPKSARETLEKHLTQLTQ